MTRTPIPGGAPARRIRRYGTTATLTNDAVSIDESTDWNTETRTPTTTTVTAQVDYPFRPTATQSELETESEVEAMVYFPAADVPDTFTVRDVSSTQPRTVIAANSREFAVIHYTENGGVIECECEVI